ncbi:hypothetical protein E1B28_008526 [Marasmius oreades]|uniref:Uncharacterized protein n=1 Tax=Marasmius oreades TaxID=181124 RepID=A0A9P7RYP8_9AGAR|nr:uncharacterized protein E1B28_008526 [Marasmius oreades]KAG7092157.1 hypothetical protein E1B28_008526 [Marasmius oreades]
MKPFSPPMFLQRRHLRRLLKVVGFSIATWLIAAALYLVIPSPIPDDTSIIESLQNGQTITRVFDFGTFFPVNDRIYSDQNMKRRDSFIMQFKIKRNSTPGSRTLLFGGYADGILDKIFATLDSSSSTIKTRYHNITLGKLDGTKEKVSPPIALDIAVGGKVDLIPARVGTADTALLDWWLSHETTTLKFRVRSVPAEKVIEIWPDSNYRRQATLDSSKPLLSISVHDIDSPHSFIFPRSPDSSSPSTTYPIRLVLLSFLVPIGAMGALLVGLIGAIVFGIYHLLFLVLNIVALGVVCVAIYGIYWWIKHERPRMSVSLADVRNVLDTTLADVRRRNEAAARDQSEINLEAQDPSSRQDMDNKTQGP